MDPDNIVRARGLNLPISTKDSIEICNFIRSKNLVKARKQLTLVLEKKVAIPQNRFNSDRGHRKGKIGPGFFPEKPAKEFIQLLNNLESNAFNKGLNVEQLIIKRAVSNKGEVPYRHGRWRTASKRTHIELMAQEKESKKEKTKEAKK